MLAAIRSGAGADSRRLEQIYEKAQNCSQDLIRDFHKLIQVTETLTKDRIRIFE